METFGSVAALFGSLGMPEILLILAIVVLLFGASRIPEVARSLGRGVDEFKKGLKGEPEQKQVPPPPDQKKIEDGK